MSAPHPEQRIQELLRLLYGLERGDHAWNVLRPQLELFKSRNPPLRESPPAPADRLTERDAILITYGDQFRRDNEAPLRTLAGFANTRLADLVSGIHILPFYPYSSDDGFSVMDYLEVNPDWGTWDDVAAVGENFRLMFDAVINHISKESAWFQAFLRNERPYTDYFITADPTTDLSAVVRPRTSPLLHPFETAGGTQHVWTTFSEDQIDLNFAEPQVLIEILNVLLTYVERGAELIRLDAVTYLWKEIGTNCVHLPQTHACIKLMRSVMDAVAPGVVLLTETNVPHADNIRYFGDGTDEAQMVYNFALPPLVLHTFRTGDATTLAEWAATLTTPSPAATFFNFTASHDGVGVIPVRDLLDEADRQALVEQTLAHGGKVSYKTNADGSQSAYELNITYFDALNDPGRPDPDLDTRRFLASQAIMLALPGVPGIYVHSLLGSRNCHECVQQTGRARSINRAKFDGATMDQALADTDSLRRQVFDGYRRLLTVRRSRPEFHPNAPATVLDAPAGVFALERGNQLVCLVNVTGREQVWRPAQARRWRDLLSETMLAESAIGLEPYQTLWLAPEPARPTARP